MTATVSFDRTAVAPVDPQGHDPAPERQRRAPRAPRPARDRGRGSLHWAWLPALISVSVNAVFLIAWWAPEFGEFAGRDALLAQLWPLASAELVSAGQAVVPAQAGQLGLLAALMLLSSVMLPFLARSRSRPVRLLVPVAAVYVGATALIVTLVQTLSATDPGQPWLSLLLMVVWVGGAAVTVHRSRFVAVADLPDRRPALGWLVAVFALLYPLPIALGRALFAHDVADAARGLLAADPTQQLAVLATASSALAYAAGVLVALVTWAVYMLIPPHVAIRVPWVRRKPIAIDALVARIVVFVVCAAALVLVAFPAAEAGGIQARRWLAGNPTGDHQACAIWEQQRPGRPTATLLARGEQCRDLVAYAGYTESGTAQIGPSLSPVKATMPDRRAITSRMVAGQYGSVVVLASTTTTELEPDELFGVSLDTAGTLWSFRCDDDGTMRLRFAGTDPVAGAAKATEVAAGHVTNPGERPAVVVLCTNQAVRLDPATGLPSD
jgi:hypothetical protein